MRRILSILCFITLFNIQSLAQFGEEGGAGICLGPQYDKEHTENGFNGHWLIIQHCRDQSSCLTGEYIETDCHEFSSEWVADPPPDEDPDGDDDDDGDSGGGGGSGGSNNFGPPIPGGPTNLCPGPTYRLPYLQNKNAYVGETANLGFIMQKTSNNGTPFTMNVYWTNTCVSIPPYNINESQAVAIFEEAYNIAKNIIMAKITSNPPQIHDSDVAKDKLKIEINYQLDLLKPGSSFNSTGCLGSTFHNDAKYCY